MNYRYFSQAGQDKWVLSTLKNKPFGFFVDLGAYDGVEHSNSLALEQFNWSGICVEANYGYFSYLIKNRPNSLNVNVAVSDHVGELNFSGQLITADTSAPLVRCSTIHGILDEAGCPEYIDYMSIDIEGVEYDALSVFEFDRYFVDLITVEHNLYCDGPDNKDRLFELLTSRGFTRVVEDAICLDSMYYGSPYEDWYRNSKSLGSN